MAGVYIHVPFCLRKCPYCDFYSAIFSHEAADEYTEAVIRNLRHYGERFADTAADTVYFGGGTPSLLSPKQIENMLSAVRDSFRLSDTAEITLEANPGTVTEKQLGDFRAAGVNRISFGVQSFSDEELRALGRLHDAETAVSVIKSAYIAGFDNISADLMLGIMGQNAASLSRSIDILCSLPVNHISAYMLKVEENTPYAAPAVKDFLPDDDTVCDIYLAAATQLERKGYLRYEISNFALPGKESRHNLNYWRCGEYIGIGPAAHSCIGGSRFAVPKSLREFIAAEIQPTEITDSSPCGLDEYVMLGLRLTAGVSLSECADRFGADSAAMLKKAQEFAENGLMTVKEDAISLTAKGCLVSNSIITEILEAG